jgi:hypothetical protein
MMSYRGSDRSRNHSFAAWEAPYPRLASTPSSANMSSTLDPTTSHLAGRLAATTARRKADDRSDDEDDEDIFAELEAELEDESGPGMAHIRERGLQQLKQE